MPLATLGLALKYVEMGALQAKKLRVTPTRAELMS